nr:hypothetical protein L203_06318 [Cryptococcus depauperatus CBS 7841]
MYAAAAVLFLSAVTAAAAGITPRHMGLVSRQFDSSTIPSKCQNTCKDSVGLYQDCISNSPGCQKVCQQDTFNGFISCFDCILTTFDTNDSEQHQLDAMIDQLKEACTLTGATLTGSINSAASAAESLTVSGSDNTSQIGSLTSAASGVASRITTGGNVASLTTSGRVGSATAATSTTSPSHDATSKINGAQSLSGGQLGMAGVAGLMGGAMLFF